MWDSLTAIVEPMVQAQARAEDQAVQLHEKLEAKRAATHAEKVTRML